MRCKVPADESVDGFFYPERGDIVSLSGKNILVLSKNKDNSQNACFIGAVLESESDGAVHVKGETVEGYVSVRKVRRFVISSLTLQPISVIFKQRKCPTPLVVSTFYLLRAVQKFFEDH